MLKIYDTNHNAIGHIVKYKDLKIEATSPLVTGHSLFTYMARHHESVRSSILRLRMMNM